MHWLSNGVHGSNWVNCFVQGICVTTTKHVRCVCTHSTWNISTVQNTQNHTQKSDRTSQLLLAIAAPLTPSHRPPQRPWPAGTGTTTTGWQPRCTCTSTRCGSSVPSPSSQPPPARKAKHHLIATEQDIAPARTGVQAITHNNKARPIAIKKRRLYFQQLSSQPLLTFCTGDALKNDTDGDGLLNSFKHNKLKLTFCGNLLSFVWIAFSVIISAIQALRSFTNAWIGLDLLFQFIKAQLVLSS